jgi:hypothetical protein
MFIFLVVVLVVVPHLVQLHNFPVGAVLQTMEAGAVEVELAIVMVLTDIIA